MTLLLERPQQLVLEDTACLLCGADDVEPIIEAADPLHCTGPHLRFRVVRCAGCGLTYTNPRPSVECIGRFYPEDYAPYEQRGTDRSRESWARRQDPFTRALPLVPGGRLLDFGCGAGEMLLQMHAHGWTVTGLDVSPRMVDSARTRLGFAAALGSLPHPELKSRSFEAVIMSQSLEHVHDPLSVLRAAHRLLTPGGKVVVAVPNIDSLSFQWFGTDWWGLDLPRHLTHFSPSTLHRMLERAGFQNIAIQLIRHNSWFRRSAALAARHPERFPFWARLLRQRIPSSIAGWYSVLRRRANCILAIGTRTAA